MKEEVPFLSFYKEHSISPVRQDISDLSKHFARRSSLYHHLGIPPGLIEHKNVLEFGPGSGHNAIYTASLLPKKYVLVDGNPTSLKNTEELLQKYCPDKVETTFIDSNALDFVITEKFDLVLAEGLVQLQNDPSDFARKLSQFTRKGGLFVLTTCDPISFFSESLRRFLAVLVSPLSDPLDVRLSKLLPIFKPHARTLVSMSRKIEDWLIDTVIIPFIGQLFSMPDAIRALENDFDFYNSSPRIYTDWRWYKMIDTSSRGFNEGLIECYYENLHNLIDYRFFNNKRAIEKNLDLESLCYELFLKEQAFEKTNNRELITIICKLSIKIADNIKEILPETSDAIDEFVKVISVFSEDSSIPKLNSFESFFGRGMQYASFLKKEE